MPATSELGSKLTPLTPTPENTPPKGVASRLKSIMPELLHTVISAPASTVTVLTGDTTVTYLFADAEQPLSSM